jgi:hypothetical protein
MRKPGFLLLAVILAALALFAWWQRSERMEAERRLGLDASRVVAESFSNAAQVKVGTLNGKVVARGEDRGFLASCHRSRPPRSRSASTISLI